MTNFDESMSVRYSDQPWASSAERENCSWCGYERMYHEGQGADGRSWPRCSDGHAFESSGRCTPYDEWLKAVS